MSHNRTHAIGASDHSQSTLAVLNTKISDADLASTSDLTYVSGAVESNTISLTGSSADIDYVSGAVDNNSTAITDNDADITYLSGEFSNYVDLTTTQSIGGDKTFTDDVRIEGTLTALSSVIIEGETVRIADNILTLNANVSGDISPTEDAGIEISRGNQPNARFMWNETDDEWTLGLSGSTLETIATETYVSNTVGSDVDYISGVVNNNSTDITNNDADITYISGEVDSNSTAITNNDADIDYISGEVDSNSTNIINNDADIVYLSGEIDNNSTAITDNDADITYISGEVDSNSTNITNNDADITYLSGEIDSNSTAITNNDADIAYLSGAVVPLAGTSSLYGSIIPTTDGTIDLGDPTHQFRSLYLSGSTLYLSGYSVGVGNPATTGRVDLVYDGKRVLDESNAYFADIQDVNIPTNITLENDNQLLAASYTPANAYGDSSDGDPTISSDTSWGNSGSAKLCCTTTLKADYSNGDGLLSVVDATDFEVGCEVIVHQVADYTNADTYSGQWSSGHRIIAKDTTPGTNTLTLDPPLAFDVWSIPGSVNAQTDKCQLIRVAHVGTLTVNSTLRPDSWSWTDGGAFLAIRCQSLQGSGSIIADSRGFAGGPWGFVGTGSYGPLSPTIAHAGGWHQGQLRGASGGNRTAGGNNEAAPGGAAYSHSNADTDTYITFGGGGGGSGGAGGGIILVYANAITMAGAISATGADSTHFQRGSGAGGSVRLLTPTQTSHTLTVNGGSGGGDGGDGYSIETRPTEEDVAEYVLGVTVSTETTLSGNSDLNLPTEKAIKTYVDTLVGTTSGGVDPTADITYLSGEIDNNSTAVTNNDADITYISGVVDTLDMSADITYLSGEIDNREQFRGVAAIDLESVAQTTIHTVTTGKRMVIDQVELVVDEATPATGVPTVQFGPSTDTDGIVAPTVLDSTMLSANSRQVFDIATDAYPAGTVIQFGVTNAGTDAGTYTGTAIIRGVEF